MQRLLYVILAFFFLGGVFFAYQTAWAPAHQGTFGGVSLSIDYATTPAARERGLGGRTDVPEDYAMLFVFPKPALYGFWMKDTLVPLDIYWLNAQGQVVYEVPEIATTTFPHVFYPSVPAQYVLEMRAGFARAHSIQAGTKLLLPSWPHVTK